MTFPSSELSAAKELGRSWFSPSVGARESIRPVRKPWMGDTPYMLAFKTIFFNPCPPLAFPFP